MAAETTNIMPGEAARSRALGTVLPLGLWLVLLAILIGGGTWLVTTYVLPTESTATQDRNFVLRRLTDPLHLAGRDYLWLLVLIPLLAAGFFYAALMYRRDGRTVGWAWATFLGTCRCAVYLVLAVVFLLPATQTWDKIASHTRVLTAFDVSGSMVNSKDDLPTEKTPVAKLPTRQDKVIRFLGDEKTAFFPRLQDKNPVFENPVYAWRFGAEEDKEVQLFEGGTTWSPGQWAAWLKPDLKMAIPDGLSADEQEKFAKFDDEEKTRFRNKKLAMLQQLTGGTNLGGCLKAILDAEANRNPLKLVQGLIVFSDGRSNLGSAQAFEEIQELTHNQNMKVPIFVVAVGQDREPTSINITVLQAPSQTRGDDAFPVRVEVDGEGLANQEFKIFLDITKITRGPDGKDKEDDLALTETKSDGEPTGKKLVLGKKLTLEPEKLPRFSPKEKPPHASIEFKIDPTALARAAGQVLDGGRRFEMEGGDWKFTARVPREKREIFLQPEHVSDPATVTVIKKPLRILLFAGAPTREYQFVRSLLVREVDRRRAELSVYLQLARPEVVQDVPVDRFLKRFPYILRSENDPQVKPEDKYYNLSQYDLIIAFDPDWSQLLPEQALLLEQWVDKQAGGLIVVAGPVNTVELTRKDNRDKLKPILDLYPVLLGDVRDLDRTTNQPWRLNFPGASPDMEFLKLDEEGPSPRAGWEEFFTGSEKAEPGKDVDLRRGFFGYYPVEGRKPVATVIASFSDPRARLPDGQEQPYLVSMPYGSGKVVYLGSGETWRLRQFREIFHERFWTKLARYAGSGNVGRLTRLGMLNLGRTYLANKPIDVEAKLFGRDLQPLVATARPEIKLTPPADAPADAAPAKILMQAKPTQGEWNGYFTARFELKFPGEYGIDVQIPETGDVLQSKFIVKEPLPEELENTRPDFATLYQLASKITDLSERLKDRPEVWEKLKQLPQPTQLKRSGDGEEVPRLYFDLKTAALIPDCMVAKHEVKPSRGGFKDLWDNGIRVGDTEAEMSTVMLLIVALLSLEWLTRKLLKLA